MAQVLYRKWRPRALSDVVGQETVTNTLKNAVSGGRLAHAFLFCGPRGTGKTSTARVLAKAVNCAAPVGGEPDNACDRCRAINESRALDLIEIDAASNRGIDDIRDLSDKIGFAPTEFPYKVYIVDEVHMLTDQAFNALLKTLEEPPDHAIFILATTEIHRVPLTIVSRCQRYDFRRIPLDAISEKLAELCRAEGVEAQPEALEILARHSTGSLRDAENLLEQAVVSYGSPLAAEQVSDMLDLTGNEDALELCDLAVRGKTPEALTLINRVAAQGADLRQLQRAATEFLRAAMLASVGAEDSSGLPDAAAERVRAIAAEADAARTLRTLKAFSEADMRRDSSSPLPLELALIESAAEPQAVAAAVAAPQMQPQPARRPAAASTGGGYAPSAAPSAPRRASSPARAAAADSAPPPTDARSDPNWNNLLRSLRNAGARFKIGALLRSARGYELDAAGGRMTVKFAHNSHIERIRGEIDNPAVGKQVREAISQTMDGEYELVLELANAAGASGSTGQSNQSHLVRAAQAMGARMIEKIEEGDRT